jgi:hypothetical protein
MAEAMVGSENLLTKTSKSPSPPIYTKYPKGGEDICIGVFRDFFRDNSRRFCSGTDG